MPSKVQLSDAAISVLRLYAEAVRDGNDDPWYAGDELGRLSETDRLSLFDSNCLELERGIGGCKIAVISGTGIKIADVGPMTEAVA